MAADAQVHRAHIQAGPAADAIQDLRHLAGQGGGAAVIDQDDVHLLRAVLVGRAAGAGEDAGVDAQPLTGGAAGQHLQQCAQIGQAGGQAFDPGQGYVDAGRGRDETAVALIRHQRHRAGLGADEIGPADAHICLQKAGAQGLPGRGLQSGDVEIEGCVQVFVKELGHIFQPPVHRRRDDVAGVIPGQLHDVLAQVGFQHLQAGPFQHFVDLDLFAQHRLALHHPAHVVLPGDVHDDFARLLGIARPMHLAVVGLGVPLEGQQMLVQVGDGVGAQAAGVVAQGLAVGQGGKRPPPPGHEMGHGPAQRLLQGRILQGNGRALVEG